MSNTTTILFQEALKAAGTGRKHLLLGNGFSIACDKRFSYPNLFDYACQHGLSAQAQAVFQHLGTNNFEGVLRLLEDGIWLHDHYSSTDVASREYLVSDLSTVKNALVSAVAETHLEHSQQVEESKKLACVSFLSPFHNVFTTNYDLLLYWVAMQGLEELKEQDGFRSPVDNEDAEYLVFREHVRDNKGMFFLHGALHLYVVNGEVRKHSWIRSKKWLTSLIREGLENKSYPLFVAEGLAERKRQQIQNSGYLSYCLGKLERIQGPLFIHGMSLGSSDQHIADTLADNLDLPELYIGLFGDPNSAGNRATQTSIGNVIARRNKRLEQAKKKGKGKTLTAFYYQTESAPVWA